MKLPDHPQNVEVTSRDGSIVVEVTDWGQPLGVQLGPAAQDLSGSELASRIMTLYRLALTIVLAVRNNEHHSKTGNWLSWPTQTNVDRLYNELTF
ncbi:MAG: DUF2694 domain-containing protein [Mycolicibacterium sp.]|uniref:hypothetical protein n=1 Tax=Mycolicibacterium sp. TaxID=2320850 RepID=UPI003D0B0BDF